MSTDSIAEVNENGKEIYEVYKNLILHVFNDTADFRWLADHENDKGE